MRLMFGDLNGSLGKEREKMNKEDIIKQVEKEYQERLHTARIAYKVVNKMNGFELDLRGCSPYTTYVFLEFASDDLLLFEERLSELTDALGNIQWKKTVTQEAVHYETDYFLTEEPSINIYISIYVKAGPYCSIVKVPTGRKVQVKQMIEEVPEYEYRVDCGKNLKEEDEEESVRTFEDLFESEMNKESTNPFTSFIK
jgi:hypothetical protein